MRTLLRKEPFWRMTGHLPKGLIPFHRYPDDTSRCSFEEHAMEWELLAGRSPLHFTVSERHQQRIQSIWKSEDVDITTSVQSPSTDTLAWDLRSETFARNVDGSLLFRPGGPGALPARSTRPPSALGASLGRTRVGCGGVWWPDHSLQSCACAWCGDT